MGQRTTPARAGHRNEIVVAGRITAEPSVRELPSGDRIATWRICAARTDESRFRGHRSDSITCVSFDPGVQERVRAWRLDEVVEMTGALRRRVRRVRDGVRAIYEVEVRTAERVGKKGEES
ncbi:single stranded DNA-binding domain-containing protein [Nocardiopsis lucentensis]|uniref:single-stranded DNA-binding protein n=1 Tax=Nocardiopsis lucentensis TaxID=53441 RepID=UPI000345A296|nr:single-stranded DNA-binding protein [Nocardiopsis lucentensis]